LIIVPLNPELVITELSQYPILVKKKDSTKINLMVVDWSLTRRFGAQSTGKNETFPFERISLLPVNWLGGAICEVHGQMH
jgi:hypothetical protein